VTFPPFGFGSLSFFLSSPFFFFPLTPQSFQNPPHAWVPEPYLLSIDFFPSVSSLPLVPVDPLVHPHLGIGSSFFCEINGYPPSPPLLWPRLSCSFRHPLTFPLFAPFPVLQPWLFFAPVSSYPSRLLLHSSLFENFMTNLGISVFFARETFLLFPPEPVWLFLCVPPPHLYFPPLPTDFELLPLFDPNFLIELFLNCPCMSRSLASPQSTFSHLFFFNFFFPPPFFEHLRFVS